MNRKATSKPVNRTQTTKTTGSYNRTQTPAATSFNRTQTPRSTGNYSKTATPIRADQKKAKSSVRRTTK